MVSVPNFLGYHQCLPIGLSAYAASLCGSRIPTAREQAPFCSGFDRTSQKETGGEQLPPAVPDLVRSMVLNSLQRGSLNPPS
jgi:hypothetical protein